MQVIWLESPSKVQPWLALMLSTYAYVFADSFSKVPRQTAIGSTNCVA